MSGKKRKAKQRQSAPAAQSTPTTSEDEPTQQTVARFAGLGLVFAALGLALWLLQRTWLKWADVLVDYGRELYVPWRISEGDVLYRDIAYFNGPLSPYWNALWFGLFGTGFTVQVGVNLALLGVLAFFFHRLLTKLGSSVAAGLTLCFALPVFVFGHRTGIGNYNFVSPYSHEMTHGLLLAIVSLGLALRADPVAKEKRRSLIVLGVALGLLFLTKAEIFAATAAGVATMLGAQLFAAKASGAAWRSALLGVLAPTLAVPFVAFLLLAISMPISLAGWSVLGSWTGIFGTEVSSLKIYQVGMGTDDPSMRIGVMGDALRVLLVAFVPGFVLDLALPAGRKKIIGWLLAAAVSAGTFFVWRKAQVDPSRLAQPLPLVLLAITIVLALRVRSAADAAHERTAVARLGFSIFALAMLGKMILNPRFEHYGFVLALPAMSVLILTMTTWLPAWMRSRGGSGLLVAASAVGVCSAVAWDSWQGTEAMLARKKYEVGEGRDKILSESRGFYVQEVLKQIDQRFDEDAELLVFPEGVSINYWSRRKSPVGYTNYMPAELILYGEEAILAELEEAPATGVILIHKDTTEYGFPLFGADYAQSLMKWARENYSQSWWDSRNGVPLQTGTQFGTAILERNAD